MYAQLGKTIFENLKSIGSFNRQGEAAFAEYVLYNQKSLLQFTGPKLKQLEITLRLNAFFCNVETEITTLRKARDKGDILPLLWGTGKVEGNFVIFSLNETIEDADKDGTVLSLLVNVQLKEYVINDFLSQQQDAARNNAPAVGDKKPVVTGKRATPLTCNQKVARLMSRIESYAHVVDNTSQGYTGTAAQKNSIAASLKSCRGANQQLWDISKDPNSCAGSSSDLPTACSLLDSEIWLFLRDMPGFDTPALLNEDHTLQFRVGLVKSAASPIIKSSITRK